MDAALLVNGKETELPLQIVTVLALVILGGAQHSKVADETVVISAVQPILFHAPNSPSAYVLKETPQSVNPVPQFPAGPAVKLKHKV